MCKLHIQPEWLPAFQEKKLDSMDAVLALELVKTEECCLPCGVETFPLTPTVTLCLKRETEFACARIFREILCGHAPQTRTFHERQAIALLHEAGFIVSQVVAWGEKSCFGLPRAGVLFLLAPPGKTLPAFLAGELDAETRREAIEKVEATLLALHSKGFFWPACRAANFILLPGGEVGLLNLDSLKFHKTLSAEQGQQQFEVFYSSLSD
ncbi:MAG: lipopolysaccharide kinase InaA family protein [Lentisphaeria bacterium]